MDAQKRAQIALGDADDSTDSVHDEIARVDPSADGTAGDVQTFGDLGDREELDLVPLVTSTPDDGADT